MEKFNRTLRGYDPVEVNQFLDQVIKKVENIVFQAKEAKRLTSSDADIDSLISELFTNHTIG